MLAALPTLSPDAELPVTRGDSEGEVPVESAPPSVAVGAAPPAGVSVGVVLSTGVVSFVGVPPVISPAGRLTAAWAARAL